MNNKFKKSSIILMILLIFIISLGAISAADSDSTDESLNQAEDISLEEVQNDIDESSQDLLATDDANKTFTEFNTEISDKTEVDLESNYVHSGDEDYKNGFDIDRELTINGNGKTLNPNGNLLFNINSNGKLTLNDLTIVNSYTSPDAMIKNSGTLILNNVTFTVERHILSSFTSNSEFKTIENNGEMVVNNSNFKDSHIYSDNLNSNKNLYIYGLIYNTNKITLENTIFNNNKVYNPKDINLKKPIAVCAILHNKNMMTLDNVTIKNTNVSYYVPSGAIARFEGIIYNEKGNLEINHSVIQDNALNFLQTNTNLRGIIYNKDTTSEIQISNSIIVNNTNLQLLEGSGGKIGSHQILSLETGKISLDNNYWGTNNPTFTTATGEDALIKGTQPNNFIKLNIIPKESTDEKTFEVLFTLNTTGERINTLPNYNVTISSKNLGDQTVEIKNGAGEYIYPSSTTDGDVITIFGEEYPLDSNPTSNATFTDLNNTLKDKSEIDLDCNYLFNDEVDSELANGITIDKEVTINGHGFTINSTNLAKLFNVVSGGKLTLNDVVLATDYVATGNYTIIRPQASFSNAGEVNLNNVIFTANMNVYSTDKALAAPIFNTGTLNIENSRFIDSTINTNTAYCFGLIDNNGGNLNIKNTVFDKNSLIDNSTESSVYANGLIYNMGTLTLANVNMTNNYMKTPSESRGLIRGYSDDSEITIDSSRFENNTLEYTGEHAQGTVIYAEKGYDEKGSMEISNSKFINNRGAKLGGAIYSSVINTKYINNTFERNVAENGGAIYSEGKDSIYVNNTFKDNVAEKGGAIYSKVTLQSSKSILFTENTFIGNNATTNGGAINVENSIGSNNYPIEKNVFINNLAGAKGGAIYSKGTLKITKTIFSKNTAGEGAIAYTTGTSASTITYSLFDGNVITSPTGGLLRYASSSTANYNYWGTNTPNFDELIKAGSGTAKKPTNIIIITIEGNKTLYESDVYTVSFQDNVTRENVKLFDYPVDLTATLNTVTPANIVISEGNATFTYHAENKGTDTIKVMKNGIEIAKLDIEVPSLKQTPEFNVVANDVNYTEKLDITFTVTHGTSGENIYKWSIFSKSGLLLESGNVTAENKIMTTKTYNAGNYTIEVKLSDNDEWNDLTVNDTFEIKALQVEITPTVTVNNDDTVTIDINITSNDQLTDAAGEVSFEIGTAYNKTVENGQTTITTNKLTPDTYKVTVNYSGDANHVATTKEIEFTIKQATVADDVLNITKSDDNKTYTYTIKLPKNATGNLTVTVGNKTETKALDNGEATITLEGLNPGKQEVTITYTGDGNYKPVTKIDTINVPQKEITGIEDMLNPTTPEGSSTPSYTINLPENATGNLTVTVDGNKTYTKELENGKATVTLPELSEGEHNITVTYTGDENYKPASKNSTITVADKNNTNPTGQNNTNQTGQGSTNQTQQDTGKIKKVTPKIIAKNKKFKASKKVKKYTITLKAGKKPLSKVKVSLKIKGKTYKATTNKKGKATFKIKKLTKKGKYKAIIKYNGNKTYNKTTKKVTITVKR